MSPFFMSKFWKNSMDDNKLLAPPSRQYPCITLIGMAACGKSTAAYSLARDLGWALVDSDHLLEALYGTRLQDITDAFGKEKFLEMECGMICSIKASRAVIATGGSVVYKKAAVDHLRKLGPVIWLEVSFGLIEERLARNPQRGLAIAPGQTIADIHNERIELYRAAATHICHAEDLSPSQISEWIRESLPREILAD